MNGQYADQVKVHENMGKPMLLDVFKGFNCALICSGQEGSGKTYSMFGTATDPGVFSSTMTDLFEQIHE